MSPPTGIPGPLLICATVIRLLYSGRAGLGIGLFKFLCIYLFIYFQPVTGKQLMREFRLCG